MVVIPGFIDQHTHGAAGSDVVDGTTDALKTMASALAMEGTTAFLATTAMQSPKDLEKSLSAVKEYMEAAHQTGAEIIGVHLEGPFISCAYSGALLAEYLEAPSVEAFKRYENASGNNIKLVTMAVEEDGADALVEYLVSKDIVVSIGHTNSNYKDGSVQFDLSVVSDAAQNLTVEFDFESKIWNSSSKALLAGYANFEYMEVW